MPSRIAALAISCAFVLSGEASAQLTAPQILTTPGQAQANFSTAQSDLQGARWQYFPTPSISTRNNSMADAFSRTVTLSVALQQPLWTGCRLDAGLDKASSPARSAYLAIIETRHALAVMNGHTYEVYNAATGMAQLLINQNITRTAVL